MTDTPEQTVITGLADTALGLPDATSPDIKAMAHLSGATVVRLSFRAGQTMPEHTARWPILVVAQAGRVEFTVDDTTTVLTPGTAIHVEAEITHALTATEDSALSLIVLTPHHNNPKGTP
ncbi:cupin domain-containing protein [Gordonia sp. X0973]|uniref:cupin domain-containing protein n=1 Tax=Gordonia sp. X0973 TaxID=2742602 RepID=UPI000F536D15|nr:cupin domain-containing protein [Gordonia sp. X0973]QKT06170.1 cupin domain-containing protein [Gordonia sp. X0973]